MRAAMLAALILLGCESASVEETRGSPTGSLDHQCTPAECEPDPWDDDAQKMIDVQTPDGTFAQALDADRQFTIKMVAFLCLEVVGTCDWQQQLEILEQVSAKCDHGPIHRGCACDGDVCPWD